MLNRKMRIVHPGEVLREEIIKAKGLTITEAARLLGITRTNLSNIANEKSDISPEMACRIALVFGGTAEVWANMQTKYNLHEAAQKIMAFKLKPYRSGNSKTVRV